jgi:hypothetical protein
MGLLKEMARRGKDSALSSAIEKLAEKHMGPFGKILNIDLDSSGKSIEVTVLLKGETEHITVRADRYEIIQDAGKHFIVARDIRVSRQWLDVLAKEYIQNRLFELPEHIAKAIEFLV